MTNASQYLAVHLRFEIDMVAYSLCYFGGGKEEEDELDAYRQIHFPVLTEIKKTTKYASSSIFLLFNHHKLSFSCLRFEFLMLNQNAIILLVCCYLFF
jgi:hypothetical protein